MRTTILSTTVNADTSAGSVDTARDHSSGGTENFPSFLEDCSPAAATDLQT